MIADLPAVKVDRLAKIVDCLVFAEKRHYCCVMIAG